MAKTPEYTRKAVNKYREKFDFIQVKLPKGTKEEIERLTGKKATTYISEIVLNRLESTEPVNSTAQNDEPKKAASLVEMQKLLDERKAAEQKRKEAIEQAKEAEKESKRIESLARDPERKTEE